MYWTSNRGSAQQAIRAKLTAQAEFVFWWDTQIEKDKGGRPGKTGDRSVTGLHPGRILHDFQRTAVRNLERDGVSRSAAMAMVGHKTESI